MGKLQLDQSKAIIKKYFLAVFSTARASLVQIILPLQLSSQPFEKKFMCQLSNGTWEYIGKGIEILHSSLMSQLIFMSENLGTL